ncbi:hypothetical protein MSG28_004337 [Choristoneura fumiferana]|uniref:Uncharacterized protein n=1 Tax=Choristoneura fumiferana TaxID=7141 RepID=A0ACC0KJK1_CHOFU|nr:hypothetical protein MSG28_004337 [Choristoneura fumiferana]
MIFYISIASLVFLFLYYRLLYSRFDKYGVKYHKPLPLVGNFGQVIIQRKFFGDALSDVYYGFPGQRFVGYYEFVSPVILIKDIELMKKIAIQDFESFLDHRVYISDEIDQLFGRTLFILRGNDWKNMRAKLSPAFTSAKMKQMLPFMVEIGKQLTSSLVQKIGQSKTDSLDIDIKDLSNRFANDIGAFCAFGLKVDSISEPDNKFFKMGFKASNFSSWDLLKFFGYYSVPYLMKLFKISFLTTDTKDFFVNLVLNTMKDREIHNTIRPDLMHLLMEARTGRLSDDDEVDKDQKSSFTATEEKNVKKNEQRAWTDYDLIAQALLFIIASYETISTTLSFLFYELAVNPNIQERLKRCVCGHQL